MKCIMFMQLEASLVSATQGIASACGCHAKCSVSQKSLHRLPVQPQPDMVPGIAAVHHGQLRDKIRLHDRLMSVQFVMRFAPGARSLRFVRKLPLLKAIPDNVLLSIASRMSIEDYSVSPNTPALA